MLKKFFWKIFSIGEYKKKNTIDFFFEMYSYYWNKSVLVDLDEESTTCGFETAPLLTAVKNIGQYINYDPATDLTVYEGLENCKSFFLFQYFIMK